MHIHEASLANVVSFTAFKFVEQVELSATIKHSLCSFSLPKVLQLSFFPYITKVFPDLSLELE